MIKQLIKTILSFLSGPGVLPLLKSNTPASINSLFTFDEVKGGGEEGVENR